MVRGVDWGRETQPEVFRKQGVTPGPSSNTPARFAFPTEEKANSLFDSGGASIHTLASIAELADAGNQTNLLYGQ